MNNRLQIGLFYEYNENWIAGTYYIQNIVAALCTLSDKDMPEVFILSKSKSDFDGLKDYTQYPYLHFRNSMVKKPTYSKWERGINVLGQKLFGKKIFRKQNYFHKIDFLFPFQEEFKYDDSVQKVYWIPDFQEIHLPKLFSKELIDSRMLHYERIQKEGKSVVFSSKNAMGDFDRLFPDSIIKKFILPFSVTHPIYPKDVSELLKKYKLPNTYFFVANQFWQHKNHLVVLKALKRLQHKYKDMVIAFSGKENDHRNKDHISFLMNYMDENHQLDNIRLLGFMDRKEQLCLMKNAISIIQPSLFEGWSTVVEDAKALNKYIILSNIDVHKEQISNNVIFFDSNNDVELAEIMERLYLLAPKEEKFDYEEEKRKFAQNFIEIASRHKN